jgi:hypothetical protein
MHTRTNTPEGKSRVRHCQVGKAMQLDCNTLRIKVKEEKLSLCMAQRHNRTVEVQLHPFLTLALEEVSC